VKISKNNLRLVISLLFIVLFIIVIYIINLYIDKNRRISFKFSEDSNTCAYQIEEIFVDEDNLVLKGWFIELERVRNVPQKIEKNNKLGVLLYDLKSGQEINIENENKSFKGIECTVERVNREDVNKYFECGYDYSECGFIARINKKDIDLNNGEYQIVFKEDINQYLGGVITSIYIVKGKIQYVNPKEYYQIDVQGTDLEKIVNNGICLACISDNHMCIYQYKGEIYWIAGEDFYFEDDGSTVIQYQMETTQFDKLPKDRIESACFWSNISGEFETYEITDKMNCGKYRVSVRKIPQEYSVYKIWTGYCINDSWIWYRSFRPLLYS